MATYTVTFQGISGPGTGGHYSYTVTADNPQQAVTAAWAKAEQPHRRLNRGGTQLNPHPIHTHGGTP
jgi:hypothetical protein